MHLKKKILITGANGFIGREVCKKVKNKICVVRDAENSQYDEMFEIKNLDKDTNWSGAFNDVEAVIHCAGNAHSKFFTETDYQSVNVEGTLNLALSAKAHGVKRFIFVSSIGVNGESTKKAPFNSKSKPNPHNNYSKSKYDAEEGLKIISKETGLELVIVRPTLVYGTEAPGNFGALFRFLKSTPVLPFKNVNNRRDFISVLNLADLLVTCAYHPKAAGHTFLASDGITLSTKEFTDKIAYAIGKKVLQLPIPIKLIEFCGQIFKKRKAVDKLIGNLEVDSSNIKEILDWTPPYTIYETFNRMK